MLRSIAAAPADPVTPSTSGSRPWRESRLSTFEELVAWLKTEHGFGHAIATAQHYPHPEKWAD